MKKFTILAATGAALAAGAFLASCASMRLDHLEADTVSGPAQVRQGQDIDPKLITVWGIYKDGSRKVVSIGSGSITFNKHTPGRKTVKVRVGILTSQEVSFETEVMALRSLTVASQPKTALFKQGQEPDPAWPGLEIRGEWNQMGSDKIPLSSCEITGYMKDQSGKQVIKVSYEGLTATFNVDVRSMTAIRITQPPLKIDYIQGDSLDLAGLKVTGVWEGFPAEDLSITANDITGFNANNVGIQHVSVTKNGKSAIFDVEVMALTSIVLDKPPTKTDYKAGEPLNLTGIMVYGNYTGSDPKKKKTELIPVEQLAVDGYEPNRVGKQQKVTVTVRGQSANFFVNIEEPAQTAKPSQTAAKYAIGDKGPGGGIVFSNTGGTYKEILPQIFTYYELDAHSNSKEGTIAFNGLSDWQLPEIEELQEIYNQLQRTGKVRFEGLVYAQRKFLTQAPEVPGFPGYRIVMASGGGESAYYHFDFSAGRTVESSAPSNIASDRFTVVRRF